MLGYDVTTSDLSDSELKEAEKRSQKNGQKIKFIQANFCYLSRTFSNQFDIVIVIDNALPHMLTKDDLFKVVKSISNQTKDGGIFVASIRDYDRLLEEKPNCKTYYIHKTDKGPKIPFQTWEWFDDNYKFTQYIIDVENSLNISKFNFEYRAVKRDELSSHLLNCGFKKVDWKFNNKTGYYQPILLAVK